MCSLPFSPDIIFEIFLRLRVKTLCKFRCVSKSWHTLISNPIFLKSHHHRSKQNPLLLLTTWSCDTPGCEKLHLSSFDKEGTLIKEFVRTMPNKVGYSILTCLDLVCIRDRKNVYLCNPATEELIALPEKSSKDHESYIDQYSVSFGYVPSTMEYKVLRIFVPLSDDKGWGCEVCTLGTDKLCWREVGDSPLTFMRNTVSVDGSIYLLPHYDYHPYSAGIARFNLESEEWSVLPPPAPNYFSPKEPDALALWVVGGLLCLADFGESDYEQIDLWFAKDLDQGVWAKEYSIVKSMDPENEDILIVALSIEDDGRALMEMLESTLQYYDPKSKSFENINIPSKLFFTTTFYVESFMSLGSR